MLPRAPQRKSNNGRNNGLLSEPRKKDPILTKLAKTLSVELRATNLLNKSSFLEHISQKLRPYGLITLPQYGCPEIYTKGVSLRPTISIAGALKHSLEKHL
jgi:hypothetical protein